jgi:hypothetical protein
LKQLIAIERAGKTFFAFRDGHSAAFMTCA